MERGEQQRSDRVEPVPARDEDEERRGARAHERGQVGDDVQVGAADVEALPAGAEERDDHGVHDDAGAAIPTIAASTSGGSISLRIAS